METFKPRYEPWRHGGWYVTNVRYPSGAVGCVSRNYPDKQWRIACDPRPDPPTFANRDAAARAEHLLTLELAKDDAARAMLAALQQIKAESDGGWYREHPTARALDAAIAAAEAAGITADDKGAAAARLDRAIAGELATALQAMWTAYGDNMERHATNGDNTWTDEDHAEWQHTAGGASAALSTAKAAGIKAED